MPAGPTVAESSRRALRLSEDRELVLPAAAGRERPLVMGVLNITPDSFSDGGRWLERDRALEHALRMAEEGAELLDLGAESTRPGGGVYGKGAEDLTDQAEIDRLLPVLEALRPLTSLPLSVDTRKGAVASAALDAGADLINDVSALGDSALGRAAARSGCPLVLMHSRGSLPTMQRGISYVDVVDEVARELEEAIGRARAAGVSPEQLILDPGIGFGKKVAHNVELIAGLERLGALGYPLLLGASRKSFIADLTGASVGERLPGSLAAIAAGALGGAAIVRVHDVAESVQFLDVFAAVTRERQAQ